MADRPIFRFITGRGKLDPENTGSIADLRALLAAKARKVLLYLHGGLVDRSAGLAIAGKLSSATPPSLELDDDWVQVYIIWQTGLIEQIGQNWDTLAKHDRLYQAIVRKLIQFLSARLFLPGAGTRSLFDLAPLSDAEILNRVRGESGDQRAPFATLEKTLRTSAGGGARASLGGRKSPHRLANEFNQFLATDTLFRKAVADLGAAVRKDARSRAVGTAGTALQGELLFQHLSDEIQAGLVGTLDATSLTDRAAARGPGTVAAFIFGHTLNIARNCIERFRARRDHGLHATIVEEVCRELYGATIGSSVWGWMVEDAKRHFDDGGFGGELLSAFAEHAPEKLVVVGHSAGSIWASHLLMAMADRNAGLKADLCLLAPAVRVDLFAAMLRDARALIYRCQMFTMDDALERADAVFGHHKGYIYPSSLLYLVSGLFERENDAAYRDAPILGMQRFLYADWLTDVEKGQAKTIGAFFDKNNAIYLSKGSGLTASESHGGFDDDPLTLKSIKAQFFVS